MDVNIDAVKLEIDSIAQQISTLTSSLTERGVGLATTANIWPRSIKLSGQENLELVAQTNKTQADIEALKIRKTGLEKQLNDLSLTLNETAASPNVISLGIPALIIGGGILWLLTRK